MNKRQHLLLNINMVLLIICAGCSYKRPVPVGGNEMADYWQGVADAELAAEGNPAWIAAGALGGILGVGIAWLVEPNPPSHALMGKSQHYVLGYNETYAKKARTKNTNYAWMGLAGWLIFYSAIVAGQ